MGVVDYAAAHELLVLARGHPYERDALAAVFDALPGWRWSLVEQPAAELIIGNPACRERFAAIVCYDMPGHDFAAADPPRAVAPDPAYCEALLALMEAGQGFVFLHHAIAAWPTWEEYARIVGGRFHYRPACLAGRDWPDSGYRHQVTHTLSVLGEHPVTAGLPARFTMTDELYLCPVFEGEVLPLLASDYAFRDQNFYSAQLAVQGTMYSREGWSHPEGSGLVGWAKHYRNSPIVYLQGGDDAVALGDPNYRALLHNAIRWVASEEARAWVRARNGSQASPVLEVCGLHLRVHGYRFPDARDAWDGNWLDTTVECRAHGAVVTLRGALVRTGDLVAWVRACEALRSGSADRAELAPLEPVLHMVLEPLDSLGHLSLQVELSPDYPEQRHRFVFGISQDMLPRIAAACEAILARFPPRGKP